MKSFLSAAAVALVVLSASAGPARASIEFAQTNDNVILNDGPGNNGGIFYVDVVGRTSSSAPFNGLSPNFDFPTFCVEITEHIGLGSTYKVSNISTTTVATGKNLGSFAAWLYAEFLKPALGLGSGLTSIAGWGGDAGQDANAIQYGIWKSMGWTVSDITGAIGAYDSTFLTNLQTAYAADLGWTSGNAADANWNRGTTIGSVRVMNLIGPVPGTDNAQDQLVWVPPTTSGPPPEAPEPLSFIVWSMLAMCVGGLGSNRRRAS